jgi:hypothetical protein
MGLRAGEKVRSGVGMDSGSTARMGAEIGFFLKKNK